MSGKDNSVIRVSADGYMTGYLKYAHKIIDDEKIRKFTVTGSGSALENAVLAAELIKRSFAGLHQQTTVGVREFEDTKNTESDKPAIRFVPHVEIVLSFDDNLDKKSIGYQAPIDVTLVKTDQQELLRGVSLPRHIPGGRRGREGQKKAAPTVVEAQ
jgi:hypothetical protein